MCLITFCQVLICRYASRIRAVGVCAGPQAAPQCPATAMARRMASSLYPAAFRAVVGFTARAHARQAPPTCHASLRSICSTPPASYVPPSKAGVEEVNLGKGFPAPSIYTRHTYELLRRATNRLYEGDKGNLEHFMQYGPDAGAPCARDALASFLTEQYDGSRVTADELCLTAGASSAFDLLCQTLAEPGDVVCVEEPTCKSPDCDHSWIVISFPPPDFLAFGTITDCRLKPVAISTDEHGIDVDALRRQLEAGLRPKILYTICTYHNPTGTVLPEDRRLELVSLAREYGFVIVADDVYQLLHAPDCAAPPLPMVFHDRDQAAETNSGDVGAAVSVGSFAKILGPGLRLGWIHGTPGLVDRVSSRGVIRSGGCMAHFTSGVLTEAIKSGDLSALIPIMREEYGVRLNALATGLEQHCPTLKFARPEGGYFIWCTLPDGVDAHDLLAEAEERFHITFHPGDKFSSHAGGLRQHIRLSFSFYDPDILHDAARKLGECVATLQTRSSGA